MSSLAELAGDVTVGVSSLADLAGNDTVGVVVFTLEWNSPGLHIPYSSVTPLGSLSENRQFWEVVPTMDRNVSSMECGIEAECVGHRHRRATFQREWDPAGPPLPGVW